MNYYSFLKFTVNCIVYYNKERRYMFDTEVTNLIAELKDYFKEANDHDYAEVIRDYDLRRMISPYFEKVESKIKNGESEY